MDDAQRRERVDQWFRDYADRVLAYLLHRTDLSTAEEVLQEVFVIAYRRTERVTDPPLGWLFGTARRVLANHRRRGLRARSLVERLAAAQPASAADPTTDPTAGPHDHVLEALAALPQRDQEVLTLSSWYQLSAAEASAALGCSPGAYAVRLHRARERLAARLRDLGYLGPAGSDHVSEVSHV